MKVSASKKTGGNVDVSASKSQVLRQLMLAALTEDCTRIACATLSDDIETMARGIEQLGAQVERTKRGFAVYGITQPPKTAEIDCGSCASAFRFLLAAAGILGIKTEFALSSSLALRPEAPYFSQLEKHGCRITEKAAGRVEISGRLRGGSFTLPGDVSSQFFSALLMVLPLVKEDSEIISEGRLQSAPYAEMTCEQLSRFGVQAEKTLCGFALRGEQKYTPPSETEAEGDWSAAAFWLVFGAISSEKGICVRGLDMGSTQGDRAVYDILKAMGADISCGEKGITAKRSALHAVRIDAQDIPDTVPALAVAAACAEGTSEIYGAKRLRYKESDRLSAVSGFLKKLGADVEEYEDRLVIGGKAQLSGGRVSACGDHRIAMAEAIAAAVCTGPVYIEGAESVSKSYPDFFEALASLGMETEKSE